MDPTLVQVFFIQDVVAKLTRIRSLAGEQLIFANHDLLQSRIRNLRRMHQRRVEFPLQVAYQTPRAKLAAIPHMIREIVESQSKTRFDRCHFKAYGESALLSSRRCFTFWNLTTTFTSTFSRTSISRSMRASSRTKSSLLTRCGPCS